MLAIVFGLSCSLCWGVTDFLGGFYNRRLALATILVVTQLAGLAGIAIVAVVLADGALGARELAIAVCAGAINIVGLAALFRGLAVGKMSIVAPITATSAILPIAAGLLAGERPSSLQALGILAAMAGVVAAATPGEEQHDAEVSNARLSLILAAIASVGFGLGQIGIAEVADDTDILWTILGLRIGAVAALAVGIMAIRPRFDSPGGLIAPLILMGLLDVAAPTFFAAGTQEGLLSVVAVLAALYPAVTVLLARAILKERVTPVQGTGTIAILGGVALIAGAS